MLTFDALEQEVLAVCEAHQHPRRNNKIIPFARQTQVRQWANCLARYVQAITTDRSNHRLKPAYVQDYRRTVLFAYLLAMRRLLNRYTVFYRDIDRLIMSNDHLYQIISAIPGLTSIQQDYQYMIQQMFLALKENKTSYTLSLFCSHYIQVQKSYYINVSKGLTYELSHIENR